jgi:hypothetical protein
LLVYKNLVPALIQNLQIGPLNDSLDSPSSGPIQHSIKLEAVFYILTFFAPKGSLQKYRWDGDLLRPTRPRLEKILTGFIPYLVRIARKKWRWT